ncbi:MAG: hypothetical protein C0404_04425 [Verrucomicrobia bacterium]|nr:hypothetical protein [Verrucomicrobiota bacterium]
MKQKSRISSAESGGVIALQRGLRILRLLAFSESPLTSTEIAARVGLHQSSASRILRSLTDAGYVRKPDYHSFAADYGLLTLGATAFRHFPLTTLPQQAVIDLAERCPGLIVSLAVLRRGELIYCLRAQHGHEMIRLHASGFPLHLSSPGLRLLLKYPAGRAVELLNASRNRHGWERPRPAVPSTPASCLRAARKLLDDDVLVLRDWQGQDLISAAIPLSCEPDTALALSGPARPYSVRKIVSLLQSGRHAIDEVMKKDITP